MESVLDLDIRYNNADKNYGPTAYSQELAKEQCSLHLDDQEKGTYLRIVDESKEDILRSIILKLRSILCCFKEIRDSGIWAHIWAGIFFPISLAVSSIK